MSKAMGKPVELDLEGGDFLRSLDPGLAGALRAALTDRAFRVTRQWAGNVADAYLLDLGDGGRVVCKIARPGQTVANDAAALARAADLAAEAIVPALYQVLGDGTAYLAEYVPGLSPPAYLRKRSYSDRLASEIVASLSRYHFCVGEAFGDFHPENLAVRRNGATLLDPGQPDQHGRQPGEPAMVTDLGLWLHATASNVITYFVRGPRGAWRMMDLAVDVVAIGCREGAAPPEEVLAVASRHMNDLRHSPWPRDRVTAVVAAGPCLWWLKHRIRRRLP